MVMVSGLDAGGGNTETCLGLMEKGREGKGRGSAKLLGDGDDGVMA